MLLLLPSRNFLWMPHVFIRGLQSCVAVGCRPQARPTSPRGALVYAVLILSRPKVTFFVALRVSTTSFASRTSSW